MTPQDFTPDHNSTMHDLAGAYVLHALPHDELQSFKAHLAGCGDCVDEVASLQDAMAGLSVLMVEDPPAELRSSVLDAITTIEQVDASAVASPADAAATGRTDTTPQDLGVDSMASPPTSSGPPTGGQLDNVVSLDDHRRLRRTARLVTGIAAALALVAGGVGIWANGLNDQLRDRDQAIEQVASVLNAPDAQLQNVDGASLVLSRAQQQAVFAAGSLSAPDASSVLQMWVIDDAGATSAGLVEDPSEPALLDIPVPQGSRVGITVEPAGGSDQPTTTPVVVFQA